MKINLFLDVYGHWSGCIFLASFLSVLNRQLYWCILGGLGAVTCSKLAEETGIGFQKKIVEFFVCCNPASSPILLFRRATYQTLVQADLSI